ncbi:MAG: CDP-alcohol phosphatidyltransferase family protein, partial [Ktedonobacteraceae bacterium]
PAWIVIIIVAREFLVAGVRSLSAAAGKVIPAGRWGKIKTLVTLLAIGGIMLGKAFGAHLLTLYPPHFIAWSQVNLGELLLFAADILMLLALLLTILSAIEYLRGAAFLFRAPEKIASEE